MDKRVIISYNTMDEAAAVLAKDIAALLKSSGIQPVLYDSENICELQNAFCMITVGGDGTILHWGKLAAKHGIPLLGVNRGRLGFMATLEPSDIGLIPQMLNGRLDVSRRMIMTVEIHRADGGCETRQALNDVVVERDRCSKLPEFRIFCGDSEVSKLQADGVIFSTPTGSTAYSLSAGGAIIAPDMECIECTPLCPHTLFSRPMIFTADKSITLRSIAYQDSVVTISVDGERGIPFADCDSLVLYRYDKKLELIEGGEGFFGAVRNKLMTPLK